MSSVVNGTQPSSKRRPLSVVVVGAGFGGIAAAIELRSHGIEDLRILERAPELGGTWYYNSYPGAACDVPSHLYSFSYEQRRDWSRLCSPQAEIKNYLNEVARKHDVAELVQTNTTVTACTWDEHACRWRIETEASDTADGTEASPAADTTDTPERGPRTYEADALILATGQLHQPHFPRIEGAETFAGHSFHSAAWDHDYPLAGKRVGVVGTGASAVQFVPEIAGQARSLTVFQRTGNWFLPRKNRPYPAPLRALYERSERLQSFRRRFVFEYGESLTRMIRNPRTLGRIGAARSAAFMRWQLRERPDLLRQVWPDYTFGCKRVLFSSSFLPALARPNVRLVSERIARICEQGIVTVGPGSATSLHELDCIIWATGFRTNDFMLPMRVAGAGSLTLDVSWRDGPHAYLGMCVPGFPNMFVMYGPNTNTSGGSIVLYEELQAAYLRQALEAVAERNAGAIDVRADVEERADRELQARFAGTAWTECDSWYRDGKGRIIANWPGYMREYQERTETLHPSDFRFIQRPSENPDTHAQPLPYADPDSEREDEPLAPLAGATEP